MRQGALDPPLPAPRAAQPGLHPPPPPDGRVARRARRGAGAPSSVLGGERRGPRPSPGGPPLRPTHDQRGQGPPPLRCLSLGSGGGSHRALRGPRARPGGSRFLPPSPPTSLRRLRRLLTPLHRLQVRRGGGGGGGG